MRLGRPGKEVWIWLFSAEDRAQRGEQGIVLRGPADGDAHRVLQCRSGKAADQDAGLGQCPGKLAPRAPLEAAQDKVGLAGQGFYARQFGQRRPQSLALGNGGAEG